MQNWVEGQTLPPGAVHADDFPTAMHLYTEWLASMGGDPLVVCCGDWDLKTMLLNQRRLIGTPMPDSPRQWCSNIKISFKAAYGGGASGMMDMLRKLGIPYNGRHHSGIDDCRNLASIVDQMCRDGHTPRAMTVKGGGAVSRWASR